MIRQLLIKWTARILFVSLLELIDWDTVDIAERFDNDRLADALDWDDVDLQEHVDDDRLADALNWGAIDVYDYVDEHEHLAGPTEVLHELEDDPERIYIWEVESVEAEQQLHRQVVDEYRREYGREPKAAHFVVADLDRLRRFDPDQLAGYIDQRKAGGVS